MQNGEIYEQVTAKIVSLLEQGTIPWRRPWTSIGSTTPQNALTRRQYKGINKLLLWMECDERGYCSGLWATYRQWQILGHQVRRGEHATKVLFWKSWHEVVIDETTGKRQTKRHQLVREHSLFALEQCVSEIINIPPLRQQTEQAFVDLRPAEDAIAATGLTIVNGGDQASYSPDFDVITIPHRQNFESEAAYLNTVFHEMIHASGHKHRLNRVDHWPPYASADYAMEELVAELGAAFLCSALGVPHTTDHEQSAAYIATWLPVLKSDSRAIVTASEAAAKAADYILQFGRTKGKGAAVS